jgi:hypothetical protein
MEADANGFFATWAGSAAALSIDEGGQVLLTGYAAKDNVTFQLVGQHDGSKAALATAKTVQAKPLSLAGALDVVDGAAARDSGEFTLTAR